jgi:xanthine phosphoribosyltransferase
MSKIYYPYSEFRDDLEILLSKIDQYFDTVVAVSRGGLLLGQMIGEFCEIRKVYTINTIGYDGSKKLDSVEVFNIPSLKNSQIVLIVDDIVDSGDTLIEVLKVLKDLYPNVIFFSASIFYKPTASIEPNWWVKEPNGWIDFFWSKDLKTCNY